jgi:ubiquinone/menaquinone biosynthesis C-methylase UbiE
MARMRSPDRIAMLEIERVVGLSAEGLEARTFLDVGTGTGLFAEAFMAAGLRSVGVDCDPMMLGAARAAVPGALFVGALSESLPFPCRSFDIVFLGHVLHESLDQVASLQEALRVSSSRVAILEWPCRDGGMGPPAGERLGPDAIRALASRAGSGMVEHIPLTHMNLFRLAP